METPAPTTQPARLNKVPFIIADVVFGLTAVLVPLFAEKPLGVWTIAICLSALFIGFLFFIAPFVLEFSLKLQARNGDLEKALEKQSLHFEDALSRWDRLHEDVKSIFESSKLNIAGYEGLIHRFDQRLETFDVRLADIENVSRGFEGGLQQMAKRAETLHAEEAKAWEARLESHRAAIAEIVSEFPNELNIQPGEASNQPIDLQPLEERLDTLESSLANIQAHLSKLAEGLSSAAREDTSEPWTDPTGRYNSMLDRALGENPTKPSFPASHHPAPTEETPDSELSDTSETETDEIEEETPAIEDDFLDEAVEASESTTEEASTEEDIDWPEPDESFDELPEETDTNPDEPFADPSEAETTDVQATETEEVVPTEDEAFDEAESDEQGESAQGETTASEPEEQAEEPGPPVISEHAEAASVTASILIGIGDKIFVRGSGNGLSQDAGTEMDFVNIGSYRWSHEGISTPMTVEFYLNDEIPSLEGPITLRPGEHIEISPDFP